MSAPTSASPFCADLEPDLVGTDSFKHADLADVLVQAVRDAPAPFTIGVFGSWGSGKSTILKAVGRRLSTKAEPIAYVAFDVWKYEGDSLRRQFIRQVAKQLKEQGVLKRRFSPSRHVEQFDADKTTTRAKLRFDPLQLVKAIVNAAVAFGALYGFLYGLHKAGVGGDKTIAPKVGAIAAGLAFVYQALAAVIVVGPDQLTVRRVEDSDRFERSFDELLDKLKERRRVVIGIDNLDRCSPDRVIELLATIKTFLEPKHTKAALVFVIAADDDAVRRHLLARELDMSPGVDAGTDATEPNVPSDVANAVDEYLRKYFNAVLRLPPPLVEHIEAFVQTQLGGLFAGGLAQGMSEPERERLARLVVTFLSGNPRRIKQFVNLLVMRLRLAQRRNLPAAKNPLAMAELLLLEIRWPSRMTALQHEPDALRDDWHPGATMYSAVGDKEADPEWAAFLRSLRESPKVDVASYLHLAKPALRARLTDYDVFVAALERGDVVEVGKRLAAASKLTAGDYPRVVRPQFRKRLLERRWGQAHSILVATIMTAQLAGKNDEVAAELLSEALAWPVLWRYLQRVPPEPLLRVAGRLDDNERARVLDAVLARFAGEGDDSADDRAARSEAIAARYKWLDEGQRQRLTRMLANRRVVRRPESWCALATTLPGVVPEETVRELVKTLRVLAARETPPPSDAPVLQVLEAVRKDAAEPPDWAGVLDDLRDRSDKVLTNTNSS